VQYAGPLEGDHAVGAGLRLDAFRLDVGVDPLGEPQRRVVGATGTPSKLARSPAGIGDSG